MYDIWYEQIAEMTARANTWCNFAIVCGCIGFALSIVAAVMLIMIIKGEKECDTRGTASENSNA